MMKLGLVYRVDWFVNKVSTVVFIQILPPVREVVLQDDWTYLRSPLIHPSISGMCSSLLLVC